MGKTVIAIFHSDSKQPLKASPSVSVLLVENPTSCSLSSIFYHQAS